MKFAMRGICVAAMLVAGMSMVGCSKSVEGTYENAETQMTVELQSGGKAVMTQMGNKTTGTWELKGDDVTINAGMPITLHRNKDGNLEMQGVSVQVFKRK